MPKPIPTTELAPALDDLADDPLAIIAADKIGRVLRAIIENTTADLITIDRARVEIFGSRDPNIVKRGIKSGRIRAYYIDTRIFVSKSDCGREKDSTTKNGRPRGPRMETVAVCPRCARKLKGSQMAVISRSQKGSWKIVKESGD